MNESQGGAGRLKVTGRTQLKGVLDGLVQQSKDEREEVIVVDEDVEVGARDLLELPGRGGRWEESGRRKGRANRPSSKRRRKRSRKEHFPSPEESDSGQEQDGEKRIAHVMTLFDRKVDLACFTPSTPLYVMCREWMCNNPSRTDEQNFTPAARLATAGNNSSTVVLDEEVQIFPAPLLPPADEEGRVIRLDIPQPLPLLGSMKDLERNLKKASDGSTDIRLVKQHHLQRWKDVRSRWKFASANNQKRYSDSLRVIRDMFQR